MEAQPKPLGLAGAWALLLGTLAGAGAALGAREISRARPSSSDRSGDPAGTVLRSVKRRRHTAARRQLRGCRTDLCRRRTWPAAQPGKGPQTARARLPRDQSLFATVAEA